MTSPNPNTGFRALRRVEGGTIAVAAMMLCAQISGDWWLFALFILFPDVGMLGYLAGPHVGARTYNALHSYVVPIPLGIVGAAANQHVLLLIGAIWVAHIGFDRALGYGLKHRSGFKDTHLS